MFIGRIVEAREALEMERGLRTLASEVKYGNPE